MGRGFGGGAAVHGGCICPKVQNQVPHVLDACSQDWGRDYLWINANFSRMQDVFLKAIMDQAQGIMTVPVWKAHD